MLHWRRKAADMLHRHTVRVIETQVLVQHRKDLVVENLELADTVDHLLERLRKKYNNGRHQHSTQETDNPLLIY